MNTSSYDRYEAPVIPAAEEDGLIKLSNLTEAVVVEIPRWTNMERQDICQLVLNHEYVGDKIVITAPESNEKIRLTIPLHKLQKEGNYTVNYVITGFPGGIPAFSRTTTIRIDRTAPGATLLAPMIFPLIDFDNLVAHIPGYTDMAAGDTLQTLCNRVQGPAYRVGNDDLNTQPIQISFSREFLQNLGNPQIEFTYRVTDRAGNQSNLAWPVTLVMPG